MKPRNILSLAFALVVTSLFVDIASAYYSPRVGRFLSRDPIAEQGPVLIRSVAQRTAFIPRDVLDPEEPHSYAYVKNSPINLIDPDGLKSRVTVNDKTCTITVTLNIGIYGPKASGALGTKIKGCIESHWNGHSTRKGCKKRDPGKCKVVVQANVKYYGNAKH